MVDGSWLMAFESVVSYLRYFINLLGLLILGDFSGE